MSPFQRKLAAYSRDRRSLIRGVATVLGVCVVLGFVVAKFAKSAAGEDGQDERLVHSVISYNSERDRDELTDLLLGRKEPTPEAIAHYITFIDVFIEKNLVTRASRSREEVLKLVSPLGAAKICIEGNAGSLTDEQQLLFHNYAVALYKEDEMRDEAREFLEERAAAGPPVRFANEFLGQVLARNPMQRASALPHFQLEAETFPRSDFARFQLLNINLKLHDREQLRALLADEQFRRLPGARFLTEIGIALRDPGLIMRGIALDDLADLGSAVLPLCVFAGLVWFIILCKLGGVQRLLSPRLLLYGLCLVAGFVSATFTLLLVVWQDNVLGFTLNGEFLNDLLYCFSAIGLREEVAKILFFVPFVPFIAKGRTQVEILIAAGCVGLGFSINENINYFDGPAGSPGAAFPRLVTASFLHVSLTGILGLALCRCWHFPKRCWEELVGTFVAVIMVHGLYDALLIVPQLRDQLSVLYVVVLALIARHYLRKVHATRGDERHVVSSLAVFVLGSALVVGAAWVYAMRYYDLDTAVDGVGKGALVSAVLAFIYINEFRNE